MSSNPPFAVTLDDDGWLPYEEAIRRFEDAWRRGERPALDDFLPAEASWRRAVLIELAHTDLEYRLKAGEPARADDYLRRYPELADDRAAALDLIAAEYDLRRRHQPGVPGPSRLGKYELGEVIGRGNFGVVHRAFDPELGRTVAVKVPRPACLTQPLEAERFLREARSAARLRHPGIATLLEAGRDGDAWFLVYELVEGSTLKERLEHEPLDFRQAAEVVAGAAEALAYAHRQGVVHRDLKPANLLLDAAGRPHVLDFGLAKLQTQDLSLTREGELLGTPAYMAPEQASGQARAVDGRCDTYSLGVILYELLTKERPFRGSGPMLLRQVLEEEPRPPRRLNERVPRDLETICLKCLEKEPGRRYATAEELADDLRRFLGGRPVQARPIGTAGRLWRWTRRKPVLAALTAALVVVTVLGVAGVMVEWRRAFDHLAEAERQRLRAEANFSEACRVVNEFNQMSGSRLLDTPAMSPVRQELHRKVVKLYDEFLRQRPDSFDVQSGLASAYYELGQDLLKENVPEALTHLRSAADLLEPLTQIRTADSHLLWRLARIYDCLGELQQQAGRLPECLCSRQRACQFFEQAAVGSSKPHVPYYLVRLRCEIGELHAALGQRPEALRAADQARTFWEDLGSSTATEPGRREVCAWGSFNLGHCQYTLGQREAALVTFRRGCVLLEELVVTRPTDLLQKALYKDWFWVGKVQQERGQPAEAGSAYQKAVTVLEPLLAAEPADAVLQRDLAATHHLLGNLYAEAGRLNAAADCYRRAIALRAKLSHGDPPNLAYRGDLAGSWHRLGCVEEELGRRAEARTAYAHGVLHRLVVCARKTASASHRRVLGESCLALLRVTAMAGGWF